MSKIAYWFATFFGAGLSPKAPGTVGSLASLLIWGPMVFMQIPWFIRLFTVALVFFIGLWACKLSLAYFDAKDPQPIVIDEVAGQGLALIFCPPSFLAIVIGFLLFRFFDITKVWPVSWADEKLSGPMGIMLDDILAAVYALFIMFLVFVVMA